MTVILQLLTAIFIANFYEWFFHKYVLHMLGKRKNNYWNFHWHQHHRLSRKLFFKDPTYKNGIYGKELVSLGVLWVAHVPLLWTWPIVFWSLGVYGLIYVYVHRKAHVDTAWGKSWLPWHYDHHMGKDQEKNWCVVFPLFDWITCTRTRYEYPDS